MTIIISDYGHYVCMPEGMYRIRNAGPEDGLDIKQTLQWQFFYGLTTDAPSDVEPPKPDVFDPSGHQRYQKRLLDKAEAEAAEAQRIVTRDAAVFRAIGR